MSESLRRHSILEEHFKEDMLVSSWLNLFSNIVAVAITTAYLLIALQEGDLGSSASVYYITYSSVEIASFMLYTLGFYFALLMTYPENFARMMKEAVAADVDKMTFVQRNFTANWLLLVTWSFFSGTVILLIIPITGFAVGAISVFHGVLYTVAFTLACAALLVWINMCRAENMVHYYGHGSSYVYNLLQRLQVDHCIDACARSCYCCCGLGPNDSFTLQYIGTDFKAGAWGGMFFAIASALYFVVLVASYPDAEVYYLWFIVSSMWALGAFLYAMAVMSENGNSYVLWNFLASYLCCCCCEVQSSGNTETSPLLPA